MRTRMIMLVAAAAFAGAAAAAPAIPAPPASRPGLAAVLCVKPVEPDLRIDPALKGLPAMRAHNARVRAYNDHVAATNIFLKCIADEATRELDSYYLMVTVAHEAEQNATLDRLEALRSELKLPPR